MLCNVNIPLVSTTVPTAKNNSEVINVSMPFTLSLSAETTKEDFTKKVFKNAGSPILLLVRLIYQFV